MKIKEFLIQETKSNVRASRVGKLISDLPQGYGFNASSIRKALNDDDYEVYSKLVGTKASKSRFIALKNALQYRNIALRLAIENHIAPKSVKTVSSTIAKKLLELIKADKIKAPIKEKFLEDFYDYLNFLVIEGRKSVINSILLEDVFNKPIAKEKTKTDAAPVKSVVAPAGEKPVAQPIDKQPEEQLPQGKEKMIPNAGVSASVGTVRVRIATPYSQTVERVIEDNLNTVGRIVQDGNKCDLCDNDAEMIKSYGEAPDKCSLKTFIFVMLDNLTKVMYNKRDLRITKMYHNGIGHITYEEGVGYRTTCHCYWESNDRKLQFSAHHIAIYIGFDGRHKKIK
jgi:hypothetical protein